MTYTKKHQQTNKDKKTFLTNMIKKISNNWHPSLKKHFLKKQLPQSMKTAIACLIPKRDPNDTDITKWRPISLLCIDYKITAKSLTNRLLPTLEEIIITEQSAAVPNRTIYNNLFTIRDITEYSNKKK